MRTGFGAFGGALKDLSATDLGVVAARARRWPAPASSRPAVDHVVFGNVLQTSADAIYLARHVGLRAGLPIETPAVTVNRLCGSGFEAVAQAAQQIMLGESRVVLAGGTESMSQAPHVVRGARWGLRLGQRAAAGGPALGGAARPQCGLSMAETAENLAEQYRIAREAVDCYAALSQAARAGRLGRGAFADEVVPVELKTGRPGRPSPGPPTSTCGPTPRPRRWPSCRRTSRRTGWSPRATRPASATAPRRLVLAGEALCPGARPQPAGPAGGVGGGGRGARTHGHRPGAGRRGRRSSGRA